MKLVRLDRLTDKFIELTKIDSPSFQEREMADRLTRDLKSLGFSVWEDDAAEKVNGNAGNLYAFLPGTEGSPLLFSGHMDTVNPALNKKAQLHPDGTITSSGDTVLGADDVSGLAVILEAVASIQEDGLPHRPLEILFTIAEEPYDCGSEVFDYGKIKSKEAYVLDLSGEIGGAAYAAPTILSFCVEISGKASHAGFAPEKGIHAIAAAADAISRLKMGHLDEETTLNIGTIQGGTATNIIPDRCVVNGEIRSYSHSAAKAALQSVTDRFAESAASYGAESRIKSREGCRAYEVPPDHPVIRRYQAACKKNGIEANLFKTFGGSDANNFSKYGIASIVIANAMFNVHSCSEYTVPSDMAKVAEVVRCMMLGGD
ncbi:MAG TPA: M20/M25/M40 family metallo-hydrolase [Clostridia bacterium]|nr:M20/M25/M40 family metallo-hydrolase [Clostridia bacterium]